MMTKRPRVLTEAFIKALPPAPKGKRYMVADALVPGFNVRVTDTRAKTFVLRRRTDPRAKSASALKLGKVGELSLADARTKARDWLGQLAAGNDPREAARAARANTVAGAVELFPSRHVAGQRKAKTVEREIRREIVARWGKMRMMILTIAVSRRSFHAFVPHSLRAAPPSRSSYRRHPLRSQPYRLARQEQRHAG